MRRIRSSGFHASSLQAVAVEQEKQRPSRRARDGVEMPSD